MIRAAIDHLPLLAAQFGTWKWTGDYTVINLIAASTNALNGAILARRPDHYKNYTVAGILLMAVMGGIGGGVMRDIILNKIPGAFTNPAYITLCVVFGIIGYLVAYDKGQLFREGLFQFATSFSLPWYAIVGVQAAIQAGLPIVGALLLAVIAPTAGRWLIDVSSGVAPKQFVQGEWFTGLALLAGAVWIGCDAGGLATWASVGIAFVIAFTLRLCASVPRLGGAVGEGTEGCVPTQRRPAAPRSQDRREVGAGTARSDSRSISDES